MTESSRSSLAENGLSVVNLSCVRDDRNLFSGLSFSLNFGQLLYIEGRNGSGKTSLLRILTGIRLPDEGDVLWKGASIVQLSSAYHAEMSYVGHHDGIKKELTVEENLAMARALGEPGHHTLDAALDKVRLAGYQDVKAHNLSAGQKRRLSLARLLVTDAPLWILDEPFTSLDVDGITVIEKMIEEHIVAGGMSIMTSHHQLNLPPERVERINLSQQG